MLLFNLENENNETNAFENENVINETPNRQELKENIVETDAAEAEVEKALLPAEENSVNAMGYKEPEDNTDKALSNKSGASVAIIKAVEEIVKSKTMIVSAIAYTFSMLLEIVCAFFISNAADNFAADASYVLNSLNLGYKFAPAEMITTVSDIPGVIVGLLITVLMLFAIWQIASLRSKPDGSKIGTSGATIFHVYAIIGIVLSGFMMLVFGLFGLVASIGGRALLYVVDASLASSVILTVVFVLFAVLFLPVMLYYIFVAKTLSSFKNAVKTDEPVAKGSAYVGVVLILGGVMNVLGFGTLSIISFLMFVGFSVSGISVLAYVPVALLSGLLIITTAIWNFGFGSLMLKYKKSMKKIRTQFKK